MSSSQVLLKNPFLCICLFSAQITKPLFLNSLISMSPVVRPTRHSIICEAAPNKKADSAAKRARQAEKRRVYNKAQKSEVKTRMKKRWCDRGAKICQAEKFRKGACENSLASVQEYELDGIDWTKVDFEDNQECLDLFEKKPIGLISLLDEDSNFPKATDLTFANKLKQHLSGNPCFKGERGGAFGNLGLVEITSAPRPGHVAPRLALRCHFGHPPKDFCKTFFPNKGFKRVLDLPVNHCKAPLLLNYIPTYKSTLPDVPKKSKSPPLATTPPTTSSPRLDQALTSDLAEQPSTFCFTTDSTFSASTPTSSSIACPSRQNS
ncbi:hypothetical protein HYC85_007301 [Camellia sinensis]|uniref:Myosin motor domain-containing protein n=1 Tax=Camellia sinensis TaxID=4442 RepID=A0A7J7HPF9_CAMSI|nr:hypothetical protein HYC85_007301 [Camellia sinensis]